MRREGRARRDGMFGGRRFEVGCLFHHRDARVREASSSSEESDKLKVKDAYVPGGAMLARSGTVNRSRPEGGRLRPEAAESKGDIERTRVKH